ncbi:MAG: 5-(carboxyamino)imidazole ribonucleotide synthase [Pseudomonadota bacterium]
MNEVLLPGSTVGILGGGQLGRMLSLAAARLGLKCHIYEDAEAPCAAQVADAFTRGAYDDEAALTAFANSVDVVTYEFESVDLRAVDILTPRVPVRPGRRALEVSQDRVAEKDFLTGLGLRTAPYAAADTEAQLQAAVAAIGTPSILKTRRFGYDGKGQTRLKDPAETAQAWEAIGGQPAVLEGVVPFEREISVIATRALNGAVVCFDPGENAHENGILRRTEVPARITPALAQDAVLLAGRILNALDYVGVIGVELFVAPDGLVVNEIAPRVHNSGHWTQNACLTDQFEMHIRAICGWPLGDGQRHADAEMVNLLGSEADEAVSAADGAVHLYGKGEARPGRKMGHINRIRPRA